MRRWCIIVLLDGYPVCSLLRTREKSYPCSTNLAMAKGELGSLASADVAFTIAVFNSKQTITCPTGDSSNCETCKAGQHAIHRAEIAVRDYGWSMIAGE